MQPASKKNIAIVCNALAGSGKAVALAEKIALELANRNIGFTFYKEDWPNGFNTFTTIFIVGGDGTLNYFINHYPGLKIPLVIFNGGTGNDFHWLLYGNKTFNEQLQIALDANAQPIDIGKCNEHYFINGVGIGFEGAVAKALSGTKKLQGKTSFLITILKKICLYKAKDYVIQSEGQNFEGKKFVVDITNGRRAGGGFHIAPQAKANDGLLDVIIADNLNIFQRIRYLPVIEKGKHLHLFFIHHFCAKKIVVQGNSLIQYHVDGEYYESKKLTIEVLPAAVYFNY
jgi:diacylglycerol kinase (ATP)